MTPKTEQNPRSGHFGQEVITSQGGLTGSILEKWTPKVEAANKILLTILLTWPMSSCTSLTTSQYKSSSLSAVRSEAINPEVKVTGVEPRLSSKTSSEMFDWPVEDARLTRGFMPNGTRKRKKPHLGVDLAAPKGTPIFAAQAGTVIYTGKEFKGYGKLVMVENGNGWATLYAHLDKILVSEGQKVGQGEVIAAMGSTGHSTGSHLHFEIRREVGPIDPLPFLPASKQLTKNMSATGNVTYVEDLPTGE